jgi:hypothetical protein
VNIIVKGTYTVLKGTGKHSTEPLHAIKTHSEHEMKEAAAL